MRPWLLLAGVFGATGVGMAAYATHRLAGDPAAQGFATLAANFQIWHALALVGVEAMLRTAPHRLLSLAAAAFTLGVLLFCGSLYARAFLPVPPLPTTPMGGISLIVGWVLLGLSAMERPKG